MIFFESELSWRQFLQRWYYFFLAVGLLTNFSGLFITILEPDGALYASIAKQIVLSGDFINLKVEGKDWLDKPHFPFWITAISFKIFGVNTFAYKLPALLFWGIGAIYTFKFAENIYNRSTAQISLLIYLSAAHLVISNNDVRAEPFLTGLIIASVFHLYKASQTNTGLNLLIGSLAAALALMTKGPFVLLIITSGLVTNWALKKEWQEIFHFRWIIALLLILAFTSPEIYCLYVQFDLHPEKKVFDRYGVSGIRFFLWDSQFGRFFNNGPIKGSGDPFFYFHTLLWAFLPWSLLLYASIAWRIKNLRHLSTAKAEYINPGIIFFTFLLFSLSSFQLPHYMNIIFPFFAIQLAHYLSSIKNKNTIRAIQISQTTICWLLFALITILIYFYRPNYLVACLAISIVSLVFMFRLYKKLDYCRFFGISFMAACLSYLFLNFFFYPSLLKYQSGSEAAFYFNQNNPPKFIASYETSSYSFDFYTNSTIHFLDKNTIDSAIVHEPIVIFTKENYIDSLVASNFSVRVIKTFPHFRISQLTGKFINHTSREEVTTEFVLAEIKKAEGESKLKIKN